MGPSGPGRPSDPGGPRRPGEPLSPCMYACTRDEKRETGDREEETWKWTNSRKINNKNVILDFTSFQLWMFSVFSE